MYEGQFSFGKKHGPGKLTKGGLIKSIPESFEGEQPQLEMIEGVWENDELV